MQIFTILAPAVCAVGEGGLKNRLHIYYSVILYILSFLVFQFFISLCKFFFLFLRVSMVQLQMAKSAK